MMLPAIIIGNLTEGAHMMESHEMEMSTQVSSIITQRLMGVVSPTPKKESQMATKNKHALRKTLSIEVDTATRLRDAAKAAGYRITRGGGNQMSKYLDAITANLPLTANGISPRDAQLQRSKESLAIIAQVLDVAATLDLPDLNLLIIKLQGQRE